MGLESSKLSQQTDGSTPSPAGGVRERYDAYFPRLFAYVLSCSGDETPAQEIAAEAFGRAFTTAAGSDEDRFRTVLFRTARRLCRSASGGGRFGGAGRLSPRERDVISLVFDAGLSGDQISDMFRMRRTTVSHLLMSGLRKLKEQMYRAATTARFQPA